MNFNNLQQIKTSSKYKKTIAKKLKNNNSQKQPYLFIFKINIDIIDLRLFSV